MPDDLDALALRVHQLAAVVGMLARGQERECEPLSHALYLVEADLLEVERRVERLRRM
jgi:hypothetical protein